MRGDKSHLLETDEKDSRAQKMKKKILLLEKTGPSVLGLWPILHV